MLRIIFRSFLLVSILIFSNIANAQKVTTFNLKDGSAINGRLINFENQVYTIETDNLGTIRLNEKDVLSLSSGGNPSSQSQNADMKATAQQMQVMLMSDPQIVAEMQELAQDESIAEIVSDPAFMKAILSYDPNAVMNNENAMRLMENPKIKRLMELISGKYMQQ